MDDTVERASSQNSAQEPVSDSLLASLFRPDAILAARFFDDHRSKGRLEPERMLMLAILEDAICSYKDNHAVRQGKQKKLFDAVQHWLFEPSDDWVFNFENICSVLGFDPDYLRKGLRSWREQQSP